MAELPNTIFIKAEEDRSEYEIDRGKETSPVDEIVKKEAVENDEESGEVILCDEDPIKEEDDDGEEREMEIVSVMLPEDEDGNFENEGGNFQEDILNVKKVFSQRPGPKSRKRKQSQDLDWTPETQGSKLQSALTKGKRIHLMNERRSQITATSSRSLPATETSGAEDSRQAFARPPGRPLPQIYRDTEGSEPDNVLHCDECAGDYEGDCPEHGSLNIIEDVPVPADITDRSRAAKTAPPQVLIGDSKIPGAGCGVRARETIPSRTRFGPYEGNIVPVEQCTSYSWLIRRDGEPDHCVDATELGLSNWLRFVNCARNELERNLVAFQYQGNLYYRTVCQVDPGEELLVWCGKEYGRQLGIHIDASDLVTANNIKGGITQWTVGRIPGAAPGLPTSQWDLIKVSIGENKFACTKCDLLLTHEETLASHLLTHAGNKTFSPCVCSGRFPYQTSLVDHLRQLHPVANPFLCFVCNDRFDDQTNLSDHLREVHQVTKILSCEYCGKLFLRKFELERHVRSHTGEKPFGCSFCDKQFTQGAHLTNHERTHTGEKPFVCEFCSKPFRTKQLLQRHTLSHTGEKPCKCQICGKQFRQHAHLNDHLRTHDSSKPYECSKCAKRFDTESQMKRHVKGHGEDKPYECAECGRRYGTKVGLEKHELKHQ